MGPQFEIALSQGLLQKIVREALPSLVPPPDVSSATATWFTEVDISEVVTLRADEALNMDATDGQMHVAAVAALRALATSQSGAPPNFALSEQRTFFSKAGSTSITIPSTFLLVSGSFRTLTSDDLHQQKTSDFPASLHEFTRGSTQALSNAILLQVGAEAVGFDINLWILPLTVFQEGAWGAFQAFPQFQRVYGAPLPLDALVNGLTVVMPGAGLFPVNVGLTAMPWLDAMTHPYIGLRLGFDLIQPDDTSGWSAFFASSPDWRLDTLQQPMRELALFFDGPMLEIALNTVAQNLLSGQVQTGPSPKINPSTVKKITDGIAKLGQSGVTLGNPVATVGALSHDNVAGILLTLPVSLGGIGIGNAWAKLSLKQRDATPSMMWGSYLDVNLSVGFDGNLAADIVAVLLGTVVGGIAGAIVNPMLAGIGAIAGLIGSVAGVIAANSAASAALQAGLARNDGVSSISCSLPDAQGRQTCSVQMDLPPPALASLLPSQSLAASLFPLMKLNSAAVAPTGVAFVWRYAPGVLHYPSSATMSWDYDPDWGWPQMPCTLVNPNPERGVGIYNTGQLPLTFYYVGQYFTADANLPLLQFSPPFDAPLAAGAQRPVVLGGEIYGVTVHALTTDPRYDATNPPKLLVRIFTSAGFAEFDINQPPAQLPAPWMLGPANWMRAQLCQDLHTATLPQFWTEMTFTDPVPFTEQDIVHERIDLYNSQTSSGKLAVDIGGRPLARSEPAQGTLFMSVANLRASAVAHTDPQLALLSVTPTGYAGQFEAQFVASASARPVIRTKPTRSITRWLYRQSGAICIGTPIVMAARFGQLLAVLTQHDVRVAPVSAGRIGKWTKRRFSGGVALACLANEIAVCNQEEVVLLDTKLDVVALRPGPAFALAASGSSLWVATDRGVEVIRSDGSELMTEMMLDLPETKAMQAAGGTVVALAEENAWLLSDGHPRNLGLHGVGLVEIADRVGVVTKREVILLDAKGQPTTWYVRPPWTASLIEWPDFAVEVTPEEGLLTLHDRFVTMLPTLIAPEV